jgi:hypothetical protein
MLENTAMFTDIGKVNNFSYYALQRLAPIYNGEDVVFFR